MLNPIENYISQLLYTHDCVIVMGFGGFVSSNTTSKLNRKTGLLSPPNRSILFNTQLVENDGLLINHIAQSEGISQENAKAELLKFVEVSKTNLTKYKSLRIKNIGLFTLNSDKKIIFNQDISINYNLNSFGFQESIHNKIKRENNEIIEESLKIIKTKSNFSTKRFMKAAAILIPLIGISLISITKQQEINTIYKQIANLNPFTISNNERVEVDVKTKVITETPELKTDITKVIPEKKEVVLQQTHYIIAGAFSVGANATKLKDKLNRWNYNSTIISNKKIMRVSYDSFPTKEQALSSLIKIRKENPAAWILSI